jgi:predicted transcriptional regulator
MPSDTIAELNDEFKKFLLINDPYVVKLMASIPVSQRMPSDPIWVFLVGISGAGKTEFINSLVQVKDAWALSSLTSKTLISGAKSNSGETSLLFKIQSGILIFEDFTTFLSERDEEKDAVMGQLRGIYGGKFDKSFGTGEDVMWEGKITILAGATGVIHDLREKYGALGERFVMYHLILPDGKEAALRAMKNQNSGKVSEYRKMLQEDMHHYVDERLQIPTDSVPKLDEEFQLQLIDLAEMATRARTPVQRDWRSQTKDIISIPQPESPTRFSGQLQVQAQAFAVINQNEDIKELLTSDDINCLRKIALDSITRSRRSVLQELSRYEVANTAGMATKLNLPTGTVRRVLEDLNAVSMVERIKANGGAEGDRWVLLDNYRKMFLEFDNIKTLGVELTEFSEQEKKELELDVATENEQPSQNLEDILMQSDSI